jgi:hypothetical protein
LRNFVDEVCAEKNQFSVSDPLSPFGWTSSVDIAAMKKGLRLVDYEIFERQELATDDTRRLGATRKFRCNKAAQNGAIGWLALSLHEITGKPNLRAVADLAQVTLRTEVTVDRVRHAVRQRRKETTKKKRRVRSKKKT